MQFSLTPENLVAFVGVLGPLLVGAITGLKTDGKIKALLAVAVISVFTAVQVVVNHQLGNDFVKNVVIVVPIWMGFYKLFASLGLTTVLQKYVPIYIGQAKEIVGAADEIVDAADTAFTDAEGSDVSYDPNDVAG